MFKCEKCGQDSKPGEKLRKIVIERDSLTHKGKEIEKELKLCNTCKNALVPDKLGEIK